MLDENRVRQAVALLLAKKPRGYVEILSRLHRLVKLDLEQHAARVESAVPLPADLQSGRDGPNQKNLRRRRGHFVRQNPALIGGLRIQVGSDLYDGSVKTRLEKLEAKFLTKFYEQLITGN